MYPAPWNRACGTLGIHSQHKNWAFRLCTVIRRGRLCNNYVKLNQKSSETSRKIHRRASTCTESLIAFKSNHCHHQKLVKIDRNKKGVRQARHLVDDIHLFIYLFIYLFLFFVRQIGPCICAIEHKLHSAALVVFLHFMNTRFKLHQPFGTVSYTHSTKD